MPLLNIVCPICTDTFKNSDDVYATSCGHLFHYSCMNEWKSRGSSCPQCRLYNPATHKLYLSFDESNENEDEKKELELKLETSNEKITQLLLQNSETETNFMKLQEQYTIAEKTNRELKQRIRQMQDSENNFMSLQGQYTESSEHIKMLEDRINQLLIENESKTRELELKALENESLMSCNGANQGNLTDSILNERVRTLEQKLRNISSELKREIDASTKLSIEKLKLESLIKHIKSSENTEKTLQTHNNVKKTENVPAKQVSNRVNDENTAKRQQKNRRNRNGNKENTAAVLCPNSDDPRNKCILIKNLHLDPTKSLPLTFIELAAKVNLSLKESDLLKVSPLENKLPKAGKCNIIVQFKNSTLKELFLARKNKLKSFPNTKSVIIREYMNEEVFQLYSYAKEKLTGSGFACVYCENNTVFAKENKSIRNAKEIRSKSEVDELLNAVKKNNVEKKAVVDEFYYQII